MFRFLEGALIECMGGKMLEYTVFEAAREKSKHKGLLICSPYTTNTMYSTAKPLLHTMESHWHVDTRYSAQI